MAKSKQGKNRKFIIDWSCPECLVTGIVESKNEGQAIDLAFDEHQDTRKDKCAFSFLKIRSKVVQI